MKNISKRLLSILLCFAILASFTVFSVAVSAADPNADKIQAVIEAWGNLAKQEGTVLIKAETAISELPESLGLTAAQKAQMGTHFTKLEGASGWKTHKSGTFVFDGYDKITYSIYAAGTGRIENFVSNHAWGDMIYLNQYYTINETGFQTVDLTSKLSGATGIQESNYSSAFGGPFYVGSVMGWKFTKATVPAEVSGMTAKELYDAASELDLSLYTEGVEEFKAALADLYEVVYPEIGALITAWGNLAKQEGTVLVKAETAISELPESLGLTAAQKAQMGTHFTKLEGASGWKTHKSGTFVFDGYDKITYSIYAAGTGRIENFVSNHAWGDMIYLNQYYTINETGFQTVDLTSKLSGATGIQESNYSSAFGGPFYVGSVMGWKFTKATVPAEVSGMTAKELYDAAAALDLSEYTEGVEEFKAALADLYEVAYPEIGALITAWGNLAKQEGTVLIKANTAISELPESLGLTAAQKAQMGTHFTKLEGASGWKTHKSGTFVFDGYDKITYSIYAAGTGRIENIANNSSWSSVIYLSQYYTINETGFQTVDLTSKLSGATGITESNYSSAFGGPFYVGSVMGWKTTKATIPADVSSMTAKEIYDAAAEVNLSAYTDGVEEFSTALDALKAVVGELGPVDAETATKNALISAWQAIAAESKPKFDIIATPSSATGADSQPYTAKDVTDETNIGVNNSKLGTKYMDKLSISTTGTAPAWGLQVWFGGFSKDLTKYNDVYFYANAYNASGENTYSYFITQVNGGNYYTYTAIMDWTKVSIDMTLKNASNAKFIITEGAATHITFGSLIGEYDYSPELPENYASMSLTELVSAAKRIDCEGFVGTDAFKKAIAKAEMFADASPDLAAKLIAEWKAIGNKKSDVVAVPSTSYTGTDGQVYERKEVTSETTVTGLLDVSVLGTYYIDKMAINSVAQSQERYFSVVNEFADISKYDTLSLYYAAYDANGNFIPSTAMLQINGGEDKYAATGTGWGNFDHAFTQGASQFINNIKIWVFQGDGIASVSLGSVIGHYVERPEIPEDVDTLCFVDLVNEAAKCDVSNFEATAFNAALKECQDYIKARRDALFAEYDALGLTKPANADAMSVGELVDAALALDLSNVSDTNALGVAVWNLNVLTDTGEILVELKDAWSAFAALPGNWRLLTAEQWIAAGEALDITSASPEQQTQFNNALDNVRDLLTKGKTDIADLEKLLKDAKTMNWYDFTDDSWKPFGKALEDASNVIENYSQSTQKQVDAAEATLLNTWGELRMYVRDQWFDAMDHFLKTDPELGIGKGTGSTTSLVVVSEKLPNGVPSVISLEKQNGGWFPWSLSGTKLASVDGYEFFEIWYKANTEVGSGINSFGLQLMQQGGGKYYTGVYNISKSCNDGNWHRLEIPFDIFKDDAGKAITENPGFRTGIVWGVNYGGEGSYKVSNFVLVKTQAVTAGVVPEVPKMTVIERETVKPAPPPENPFTGVDRGDPWGDAEREENAKPDGSTDDEQQQEQVAVAEGAYGSNLTWGLQKDGTLVISGKGEMEDLEGDAPWKELVDRIVQVTVEDGVTSVGDKAFNGLTKLLQVNLPQTVTKIGNYSFYDCPSLEFIVIPDKVETIGDYAFGYCYSEEEQTVIKVDGFGVYGTENSIADAYAKAYELDFFAIAPDPNKVNTENKNETDNNADADNSTDANIGNDNLSGTIGTITDPSVNDQPATDADEVVTGECGNDLTWTYHSDGTLVIGGSGDMTDFEDVAPWVAQGLDVKKAVIEEGVTGIGDSAFYGCANLSELVIPATVTRIGSFAFYECYELKDVKLSAIINRIGPYAFGYVYDAEAQDAKLLDGFKLYVSDPSAALTYAKTYEVDYEIYEVIADTDTKTDNAKTDIGLAWWTWMLIALGGVVVIGGVAIAIIAVAKTKKNKTEVLK